MRHFFLYCFLIGLVACVSRENPQPYQISQGETMGTYYRVTYRGTDTFDRQLDSLLIAANEELSTYIPQSVISRFNRLSAGDTLVIDYGEGVDVEVRHLYANLDASTFIHTLTDGAFNPCVMPLVNYWGFGYTGREPVTQVDSVRVDSLLGLVDLSSVKYWNEGRFFFMTKEKPGVELDMSAIAKGYAVDLLAEWLEDNGVGDYLVDIGGEARGLGVNAKGRVWSTGVNTPEEDAALDALFAVIELPDKAVATSGNYRNFYEVDGQKFSHTINPKTGFPERNRLLSVSIVAGDCMTADALATACMVKGMPEALHFIEEQDSVEGYFIFSDDTGNLTPEYSSGFSTYLKSEE
jgi:FAD:protein FMN transferase